MEPLKILITTTQPHTHTHTGAVHTNSLNHNCLHTWRNFFFKLSYTAAAIKPRHWGVGLTADASLHRCRVYKSAKIRFNTVLMHTCAHFGNVVGCFFFFFFNNLKCRKYFFFFVSLWGLPCSFSKIM